MSNATLNFNHYIHVHITDKGPYKYLHLDVKCGSPSILQWQFFINSLISKMDELIKTDSKFSFLIDARKIGLLDISKVKEFVKILKDRSVFIENKCICTCVVIEGGVIKMLFGLFTKFYKTKKPLFFYKTYDECYNKIKLLYEDTNPSNSQIGVDMSTLEVFDE